MKLNKKTITNLASITESPIRKYVYDYIIDEWDNYDNKTSIFIDVLYHGCQSGCVAGLICYYDTIKFYNDYKDEINEMLYNVFEECGIYNPAEIFGNNWDKQDPLALDDENKNLLAWFGFEEILHEIGRQFEELDDLI